MLERIIENNVAIIVGSLPAFAGFMRKYVAQSSVYKSLRSMLFSSSLDSKDDRQQKDSIKTFGGSGKQRKKLSYYELSDRTTLKSQITVPDETHMAADNTYQNGIVHTAGSTQQEHKARSVDRLV